MTTLGIINHERQDIRYRVEVMIDGEKIGEVADIILRSEEKREVVVSFVPKYSGMRQKVEFLLLYKQEQTEVFKSLYLWVDVTE